MASQIFNQLTNNNGSHAVGNLNSIKVRTIANGAKFTEDVDNFTLCELSFDADGQRTASQLSAVANKGYLVAAVERMYLGEHISHFYNAADEFGRIVILDEGVRFDTSAFTGTPQAGQDAHFDPTTKKFLVHDGSHLDFAGAANKFKVVDFGSHFGKATVRLEVQ